MQQSLLYPHRSSSRWNQVIKIILYLLIFIAICGFIIAIVGVKTDQKEVYWFHQTELEVANTTIIPDIIGYHGEITFIITESFTCQPIHVISSLNITTVQTYINNNFPIHKKIIGYYDTRDLPPYCPFCPKITCSLKNHSPEILNSHLILIGLLISIISLGLTSIILRFCIQIINIS